MSNIAPPPAAPDAWAVQEDDMCPNCVTPWKCNGPHEPPAATAASHCVDCCCARSWTALGITEYTGLSIPEHIAALRAERDKWRDEHAYQAGLTKALMPYQERAVRAEADLAAARAALRNLLAVHDGEGGTPPNAVAVARAKAAP